MRFLCIHRPGTPESDAPPTAEEMATMGKLIGEMAKGGVLLGAEGCLPSSLGARVSVGPFPETKELVAGFCLLQVKSKAEAIEWTKRFLAVVKTGVSEVRQLHD